MSSVIRVGSAEQRAAFSGAKATREITRAREAFLSSGDLTASCLRPLIAERWRRCQELGIDPMMQRAPTALGAEEIETILAREDLGRAGRSVLEDFGRMVEGTGHVVVLADQEGRILHAAGHSGVHAVLERVNLAPGGIWSEAAVGPNGIGTPLALGQPEMVFGPEHYCEGWQPFFCCGFPIRDPASGRILGAVDITGPLGKAHPPMALALTLSIARWVERNLPGPRPGAQQRAAPIVPRARAEMAHRAHAARGRCGEDRGHEFLRGPRARPVFRSVADPDRGASRRSSPAIPARPPRAEATASRP